MKILDKKIKKQEGIVIVTKSIEQKYAREQLIVELNNVQREKIYIINQNKKLKEDYDRATEKENDIKAMLAEFQEDKFEKIIK